MVFNTTSTLYYGDNLDILRKYFPNECVDLIYLDPPFNSKASYNILFKEASGEQSTAQIQAFSDFWHWDAGTNEVYHYLTGNEVDERIVKLAISFHELLGKNDLTAYLFMMTIRLLELYRVLKHTGCLFLHCDPTASHYLKLVLDAIFDPENFRNEIIWKRSYAHNDANRCGAIHDTIFFYSKTSKYQWHPEPIKLSEEYKETFLDGYDKIVNKRYQRIDLTGAGVTKDGNSGKPWRGIDPSTKGRHWAIPNDARKLIGETNTVQEALDKLDKIGRIHWTKKKGGMPRFKVYEDELDSMQPQDIWTDIPPLHNRSPERLGFQTQKPVALLERIIKACSREGDWILDPFCGCGTAVIAAETLRRHWIGIDITWLAINLVEGRLKEMFPNAKFEVEGEPRDMGAAKELAKDRYQFQWWALSLIRARPAGISKSGNPREGKKGADEGVDGWLRFRSGNNGDVERIVVQVKSGHVGVKDIRELRDVIQRQHAAMGIFITLERPTSEMIREVRVTDPYVMKMWQQKYPKIQIMTIEQLLKGERPEIPPTMPSFQQAQVIQRVQRGKSGTRDSTSLTHTLDEMMRRLPADIGEEEEKQFLSKRKK